MKRVSGSKIIKKAVFLALAVGLVSCGSKWDKTLPNSTELGSPRGYRIARTQIHLHTPYSYDACDSKGMVEGVVNAECLAHFRSALCKNRVDFAFLTDHPANMASTPFRTLLLEKAGDSLIERGGNVIGNQLAFCDNGHQPILTAGYESKLMPIGMTGHFSGNATERFESYQEDTVELVQKLRTETDAIVIVPHSESRTNEHLRYLRPDAIEIYNLHANLDPKIRKAHLGMDYFQGVLDLLVYWIDPYRKEEPDLAFLVFLEQSPVYLEKWNTLLGLGMKVGGVAGTDAHENTFPWQAPDGERLDSHRRLMRWIGNHYLVMDFTLEEIKASVRAQRGYAVFEGLGSPVGFDFFAEIGNHIVGMGESRAFLRESTLIHVKLPRLHPQSPRFGDPKVILRLKRIDTNGKETEVARSIDSEIVYAAKESGVYRAEIHMVPYHLKPLVTYGADRLMKEYPWIVSNPIYLE